MYLKQIDVFGFKSFMNKLELRFGEGITCIIGPNGCGKSNISDGIRWVLGEQNARLLRGETMDDVIFNGTRTRKPLGMAEVSLTISNASRIFPVDFSEIRVTRRVYRSGVSEYLINKSPCRLLDVRNLFMDTGLGSSAYVLLERNMVDHLLNDTSANLRFMLEEAAGIMKYKTQEKIAVRKLEATEGDLVRIRDIVSEVEKRVRTLRRQIVKARRHNELTEEIRALSLLAGRLELERLQGEETELSARRETVFRELHEIVSRLAGVEAGIESDRLVLREKEEGLAGAEGVLEGTDEEIERVESGLLVLEERERGVLARRTALGKEIEEANERICRTAELRWTRAAEREKAAEDIRTVEEDLRRKKEENGRISEKVANSRAELLQRKQQTLDLFRDESEKRNELGNLETRFAHLVERENVLDARIAGLEREEAALAERAGAADGEHERRSVEAQRLRGERDRAEEALDRARAQAQEMAEGLVLLQGKRESLEATLQFLHRMRREYEGYRDGVRTILTENPKPESVLGVVAEMIEVDPPEFLAAFENALGESLQCLLVGRDEDALDLLRFLRDNERGWAALLSGERARGALPDLPHGLLEESGVIGAASRFVRSGGETEAMVRFLLADVVFVRDLETAARLAGDDRWRAYRFVTPSGEGARFPGVLHGGARGGNGVGVFERRSRIAEVEAELKEASRGVSEMTAAREKADRVFEACRAERDRIVPDLDRIAQEVEEAGRERARVHAALESIRGTVAGLRQEKAEIARERGAGEARLAGVRAEFQVLGADGSEADRSLREIEAEMVELEMQRDEARRLLAAAEVARAEAEGRRSALSAELDSLEKREGELAEEVTRKREELAEAARTLEETSAARTTLLAEEGRLAERRQKEAAARDEILVDVNRLRGEIRAREDSIRGDRKRKEALAEENHAQDLRLQEVQLQRKNLLERIREEFGTTPEEAPPPGETEERTEEEMRERIAACKEGLRRLGPVNLVALDEYEEENDRYEFLKAQEEDLLKARDSLKETIRTVDRKARTLFLETFERVRGNFRETFRTLFEGGEADFNLVDPSDPLLSDIEIVARPGQKRAQKIALLSGGERALTAIAILFALYQEKPSPFCILDELDAPLDDANVGRFLEMLRRYTDRTQFVVITHNRQTMEAANYLYGVTMEEAGISRVVSVRLGRQALTKEEEEERIAMIQGGGA
ncbi:MAG: chromosome segregation protein SMC [Candidatus Eisenbacteria bacterium]|nr:chromosome segregation protein SMC [Candidatus Eisenbacteria bacterium]